MKFFCEYCGSRIDANVDDKCPQCGASYKKNKSYIKLEEEKAQNTEEIKNTAKSFFKGFKIAFIIPIVFFVIIFVTIIITFATGSKSTKSTYEDVKEDIESKVEEIKEETKEEEDIQKEVTVQGLNVYGETDEYKFMVTGYQVVESKWSDDYDGTNECVKFSVQVVNK